MFVDGWLLFDLGPLQGLGFLDPNGEVWKMLEDAVFQHGNSYGNLMNI